jgi:hypothetical protein
MKERLPVVLSATALIVAIFGSTPVGQAAERAASKVVPYAKRAGFAVKAGLANRAKVATTAKTAASANAVSGIGASTTPTAGKLFPLGPNGKFPASVVPAGTPPRAWGLSGNLGTSPGPDFLGTSDNQPLVVKTNNAEALRVTNQGDVGIGTGTPRGRLDVDLGSATDPAIVASGAGGSVPLVSGLLKTTLVTCTGYVALAGCADDGVGVVGRSNSGTGVDGLSASGNGVVGNSPTGRGVEGSANAGIGVIGTSDARGVVGTIGRGPCPGPFAVGGCAPGSGVGVKGTTESGTAVVGMATTTGNGVSGASTIGRAVEGNAGDGIGVIGTSNDRGVIGTLGRGPCAGTYAVGGCAGSATGYGIYGQSNHYAGWFTGAVNVVGTLTKTAGSFRIDHPLHPATEYLQHSFVESPDMKNVYDGIATTDNRGFATVRMPRWFQALNRTFRYQLTVLGHAPWGTEARVWDEIAGNRFTIRTSKPRVRVSWQVTGVRHDAYANAHRIAVVLKKPAGERGKYLHPELYGRPKGAQIGG